MKSFVQTMIAAVLAGMALIGGANASVTIGGTRVIYPLDQREVTVKLENDSKNPSLVQVWMDDGNADSKPGEAKVPFVITPPIFRMDPRKAQMLRVIFSGDAALPQDRESVYWLNVLDIPPKAEQKADTNSLQFAFRTRIKVFVRPPKLPGSPDDAPRQLEWKLVPAPQGKGQALSVSNPTPYFVSFSEVDVVNGSQSWRNEAGGMVPPLGTTVLAMPKMDAVSGAATVRYTAINDYGGALTGDAPLHH
ncbi:fimbrial biogenesis chaperone [Paraburkholderia sp. SOS3]|jgi:chaperone protein EcpD|uniref:fimbrial biogenesis chaperone n=1 Tax=Paraburkholderia sp. SOS3 TaxID=1926494 RepID=UPI0009473353|nr:fimbria/pilus periplasmic chaperone [Paraburkholderia sp. SOS3]APR40081.1 molecular chaperone EcpD [Paraburkholderia sp. SOS3]